MSSDSYDVIEIGCSGWKAPVAVSRCWRHPCSLLSEVRGSLPGSSAASSRRCRCKEQRSLSPVRLRQHSSAPIPSTPMFSIPIHRREEYHDDH